MPDFPTATDETTPEDRVDGVRRLRCPYCKNVFTVGYVGNEGRDLGECPCGDESYSRIPEPNPMEQGRLLQHLPGIEGYARCGSQLSPIIDGNVAPEELLNDQLAPLCKPCACSYQREHNPIDCVINCYGCNFA